MNIQKIVILADIYLYSERDAEVITFINKLLPKLKTKFLIAMAEFARRKNWIDFEYLRSPKEGDEFKNTKIVRLNIYRKNFPELADLWEKLPRGGKSLFFVALIKVALKEWGDDIPLDFLLGSSEMIPTAKESHKEISLHPTKNTITDTLRKSIMSPLGSTNEDDDEDEIYLKH